MPPRDPTSGRHYTQCLPFQVFCCESGTHVINPAQSYYEGIAYRAGADFFNSTASHADVPERDPDAPCLDSTQAWFCHDLWVWKAKEGMKVIEPDIATTTAHSPIALSPAHPSLSRSLAHSSLALSHARRSLALSHTRRSLALSPAHPSLSRSLSHSSLALSPARRSLACSPARPSLSCPPVARSLSAHQG